MGSGCTLHFLSFFWYGYVKPLTSPSTRRFIKHKRKLFHTVLNPRGRKNNSSKWKEIIKNDIELWCHVCLNRMGTQGKARNHDFKIWKYCFLSSLFFFCHTGFIRNTHIIEAYYRHYRQDPSFGCRERPGVWYWFSVSWRTLMTSEEPCPVSFFSGAFSISS